MKAGKHYWLLKKMEFLSKLKCLFFDKIKKILKYLQLKVL